jgi:hypothetical protein
VDVETCGTLPRRLYYQAGDARMNWLDLLLFTGSVYGASWIFTKSKLMSIPRRIIEPVPLLGSLFQCIVCMSAWIGLVLAFCLERTSLFSPGFRPESPVDYIVLVCWSVAASWIIGLGLGDAD